MRSSRSDSSRKRTDPNAFEGRGGGLELDRRRLFRFARALADAIPTAHVHRIHDAGHAAPFDATANFVEMIAGAMAAGSRFGAVGL